MFSFKEVNVEGVVQYLGPSSVCGPQVSDAGKEDLI